MNDFRENRFLDRVRTALGKGGPGRDLPAPWPQGTAPSVVETVERRTEKDYQALLERLRTEAGPINLKVISAKGPAEAAASIADLVREKRPEWGSEKQVAAWDHPLIRRLALAEALAEQQVPVYTVRPVDPDRADVQRAAIRRRVIASYIGVTAADFCVVDSATLVMKTRPGQARSVSLVPSIHVAVIEQHQLIANLTELYALLRHRPEHRAEGLTNCMTFISGPSKTADIEAMLVHGAHGPREVVIYVITGS